MKNHRFALVLLVAACCIMARQQHAVLAFRPMMLKMTTASSSGGGSTTAEPRRRRRTPIHHSGTGEPLRCAVIGAGIGGLTAARALQDAGILSTQVYERRSRDEAQGGPGGIFIQRNAIQVYEQLSCEENEGDATSFRERLYQVGGVIQKGGFCSKTGRQLYLNTPEFVHADDLGLCFHRPTLQRLLMDNLPSDILNFDKGFSKFKSSDNDDDTIVVEFDDGTEGRFDLVVAADGLRSPVRRALFGESKVAYSGQICWRGLFDISDIPDTSADPFANGLSWNEYWGRGERFGYFLVDGNRGCFYAFVNADENDDTTMGAENSKAFLLERYREFADPVLPILRACREDGIYRDLIYDRDPFGESCWGQGCVTVLGDAAHAVLPALGQGACMAIEDAFQLATSLRWKALSESSNDDDKLSLSPTAIADTLREWEAYRTPRTTKVFDLSRKVNDLAQVESRFGCWLRNTIYDLLPTRLGDKAFAWLFEDTEAMLGRGWPVEESSTTSRSTGNTEDVTLLK